MSEALTSSERDRLIAAAVDGVAWALIDDETDIADRGVSAEHYRNATRRARDLLPSLVTGSSVQEPEHTNGSTT